MTGPRDPRSKALRRFGASITVATILGHTVLGFEQAYVTPIVAVLVSYLTETVLETVDACANRRRPRWLDRPGKVVDFLLPAHISGLACAMLLYAGWRLAPVVVAVVIATCSKYVVRVPVHGKLRHVLNPSNTGIVLVLLLFPSVGVASQYQFTEWIPGWWRVLPPLVVVTFGTLLNLKLTGKMPLIAGWIGGFTAQALLRAAWGDISLTAALLVMTGTAFILFTNYMITDPGTTPTRPRNQVVFGLSCAGVYGCLVQLHLGYALFFALMITCVGRLVVLVGAAARGAFVRRASEPVVPDSAIGVPQPTPVKAS